MFKIIKKTLIILSLVSVALKLILLTAIFVYPNITSDNNIEANAKELIDMTNEYRKELGLNELTPNARLTQAAVNKARNLLLEQYFAHTSPGGIKFSEWIKDVGYKYFYVGENLAIDFNSNQEIFQAWLNSESHRENIIKPQYQEIGIAVLEGKYQNRQTAVVVQLFGSRVLGESERLNNDYQPFDASSDNYFPSDNFWQKITSLRNIEKLNRYNNYFLVIVMGLYLMTYTPTIKKKNQINVKQPIINRYQAKIFRE
ncbi:MAG: CAP domain-containing protein [Candidatus Buchananbacteria bacterium]|nr:CAP domain-containing protein [Candidatus Buchananbacteria bacterium]